MAPLFLFFLLFFLPISAIGGATKKLHYVKWLQNTEIYCENTESLFMGCTGLDREISHRHIFILKCCTFPTNEIVVCAECLQLRHHNLCFDHIACITHIAAKYSTTDIGRSLHQLCVLCILCEGKCFMCFPLAHCHCNGTYKVGYHWESLCHISFKWLSDWAILTLRTDCSIQAICIERR